MSEATTKSEEILNSIKGIKEILDGFDDLSANIIDVRNIIEGINATNATVAGEKAEMEKKIEELENKAEDLIALGQESTKVMEGYKAEMEDLQKRKEELEKEGKTKDKQIEVLKESLNEKESVLTANIALKAVSYTHLTLPTPPYV